MASFHYPLLCGILAVSLVLHGREGRNAEFPSGTGEVSELLGAPGPGDGLEQCLVPHVRGAAA